MAQILRDAFASEEDEKEPQVSDELDAEAAEPAAESAAESDDLLAEEPVESDELELEDDLEAPEEPAFGGESDELELADDTFSGGEPAMSGEGGDWAADFGQQGELQADGFDDALDASAWRGEQDGQPDSPDAVRAQEYSGENHYGATDMAHMLNNMSAPSAEGDDSFDEEI